MQVYETKRYAATRLDKRAELIRERRYNALPVAQDPKVAYPSDGMPLEPDSATKDTFEDDTTLAPTSGANSPIAEKRNSASLDREKSPRRAPTIQKPKPREDETALKPRDNPTRSSDPALDKAAIREAAIRRRITLGDLRAKSHAAANTAVVDATNLDSLDVALKEVSVSAATSEVLEDSDGPPSDFEIREEDLTDEE